MFDSKRRLKYRGAEVIANDGACDAARSLANLRLLAADVPTLPLKPCDRAAACKWQYRTPPSSASVWFSSSRSTETFGALAHAAHPAAGRCDHVGIALWYAQSRKDKSLSPM